MEPQPERPRHAQQVTWRHRKSLVTLVFSGYRMNLHEFTTTYEIY